MTKGLGQSFSKLLLLTCLAVFSGNNMAYVLGGIKINSSLNEPLSADIPLTDISSSELEGLRLQLLMELARIDKKKKSKHKRPQLKDLNLAAEIIKKNGIPFIHVTSKSPLYSNCSKSSFECYRFYQFDLSANWRSQSFIDNTVRRHYSIIPRMDQALGKIKINSRFGQRLDAEISLLDGVKDLSEVNIRLAPKVAWVQGMHSGENEYKIARKLRIKFYRNKDIFRLISQRTVNRAYVSRIQTNNAPIVLFLEISWSGGRELKKYTIYMPV